ncbi:MAG: phosphoribosylformylglycinamidine synthase I [Sulfobacillus acidophilus]|uniref:Phosphoribosylformylglycinamidine synthase subunit PurQ n=1 Tax=Sulfobacillus acidophilus TaxID=53633 RepID=A0A2T2WGA6_9FIRM|nr:MAG: phosphoribosylformylglycinamidine synthase I [Sulfobacillus acidophilus]
MKIGVVTFPGSNCDADTLEALSVIGVPVRHLFHEERDLDDLDAVILPGGFSYGDYLRSGALAAKAPVMRSLWVAVQTRQLPVLGICNGFQILTEAGLLPGSLRANAHGEFRCAWQTVRVTAASALFPGLSAGELLRLPIAHGEGAYYVASGELGQLFGDHEAWLQYVDDQGMLSVWANPNGSVANIAGVMRGSVAALMPHPERAMMAELGSTDGRRLLQAWVDGVRGRTFHAS